MRTKTKGWIVVRSVNDNPLVVEGPTHETEAQAIAAAEALIDETDANSDASFTVFVLPATQIS